MHDSDPSGISVNASDPEDAGPKLGNEINAVNAVNVPELESNFSAPTTTLSTSTARVRKNNKLLKLLFLIFNFSKLCRIFGDFLVFSDTFFY